MKKIRFEPDNAEPRSPIYFLKDGDHWRNSDLNFTKLLIQYGKKERYYRGRGKLL